MEIVEIPFCLSAHSYLMIELLNSAAGSPFAYIRIPVCDGDLDLYRANQCHLGFVSVIKKTKTAHINKN